MKYVSALVCSLLLFTAPLAWGATGDTCADPIVVTVPASLPYSDLAQTNCARVNDYSATCMGSYDGGEDIIYRIDVTVATSVVFTLTTASTWFGMALDDGSCPLGATNCIFTASSSGAGTLTRTADLAVGSYYLQIDTYPSPTCIPSFDLSLAVAPPPPQGDKCVDPFILACDTCVTGSTVGFGSDYDCGTAFAGADVVYAFTLATARNVVIWGEANFDADWALATVCNTTTGDLMCGDYNGSSAQDFALSCGSITAASYGAALWSGNLAAGTYYLWIDAYGSATTGNYAVELLCNDVCATTCPGGAVVETETCGPNTNGGCNSTPTAFDTVTCNTTYCGTLYANTGSRDLDWYTLDLSGATGPTNVSITGAGDFPFQLILYSGACGALVAQAFDYDASCYTVTATSSTALLPGVYYIVASPYVFYNYPCGGSNNYWFTVSCALSVDLLSFNATPVNKGVEVSWVTRSETDTLGFNIMRETITADGTAGRSIQLNQSLIAAQGSSTSGARYQLLDHNVKPGSTYRYILEAVQISGNAGQLAETTITIRMKR
jgi:hypothetical protein